MGLPDLSCQCGNYAIAKACPPSSFALLSKMRHTLQKRLAQLKGDLTIFVIVCYVHSVLQPITYDCTHDPDLFKRVHSAVT